MPSLPSALLKIIFSCIYSKAVRISNRGRARGCLVCYLNNNIYKIKCLYTSNNCLFFCIVNLKVIVGLVYSNIVDFDRLLNTINEIYSTTLIKFSDFRIIMGGDFSAWVGEADSFYEAETLGETNLYDNRESLDARVDSRGKKLIDCMENIGFV